MPRPPPELPCCSAGDLRRPSEIDREAVWADIVARRLLADYTAGKRRSLEGVVIEEACDLAMRKIIGRVDRGRLVDHATRRVGQLLDRTRAVVWARS